MLFTDEKGRIDAAKVSERVRVLAEKHGIVHAVLLGPPRSTLVSAQAGKKASTGLRSARGFLCGWLGL